MERKEAITKISILLEQMSQSSNINEIYEISNEVNESLKHYLQDIHKYNVCIHELNRLIQYYTDKINGNFTIWDDSAPGYSNLAILAFL